MPEVAFRDALNRALKEELLRDDTTFLMGEEVAQYDGAYKVSRGLLKEFGEKRVIDTPISEAGFVGIGVGAAMNGLRPIIEVMTFNFSFVAFDQIVNSAAKMRMMSGGQYSVPMVIRGPNGAAHALGCQHSHSVEPQYCNIPGLYVVEPSNPYDAYGLLKTAIRDNNPVLFLESEMMYGNKGELPDEEFLIPLGVADLKREGSDVSIISYGKMVHVATEAADRLEKEGIKADVLDLRSLRPLDEEAILKTVQKTNRVVVVEENWPFNGLGAQFTYLIQEKAFDHLDAPVMRVTSRDVPMPYAENLEHLVMPDPERVIEAVNKVLYR